MDSSSMVQVPESKTTSFWTDEKHVNYLNTMEASFVRTMFQNKGCRSSSSHHSRQILRLDRQLPDSSESTLDLKPQHGSRSRKHHTPSDSMGPTIRRTRRRSSQPFNSNDQVVPQVENESKGVAPYNGDFDNGAEN